MKKMLTFKATQGVFMEAFELRKNPLLQDIFDDISNVDDMLYLSHENDKANMRGDAMRLFGDFKTSIREAKLKLEEA